MMMMTMSYLDAFLMTEVCAETVNGDVYLHTTNQQTEH